MIERAHLEIVRALQQQGTLTEAANHLCLTQSALSHAIKKLEGALGTPVWQKEGRGVRFTAAGDFLLSLAERLLPQLQQAEQRLAEMADGQRGSLRIGMECHPCYQWLLQLVGPFLQTWPDVDVDVKQKFQFGGMGALYNYEIDLLITPDPLHSKGLSFIPVFAYEQMLTVAATHPLANEPFIQPRQLTSEQLITYPVETERLDVYAEFLLPANCRPKRRKDIETTDIMLQMVAAGRGVAALPGWLIEQYQNQLPIVAKRLGNQGIHKHIHVGVRNRDRDVEFIADFIRLAEATRVVRL